MGREKERVEQEQISIYLEEYKCYNFNKVILTGVNFVPVQFVQTKIQQER